MKKKENYKFQNIYIISTYKCNCNCNFCLFKHNKCFVNNNKILESLKYAIDNSKIPCYIKITGGEPFLNYRLIKRIIELCNNNNRIYKIGIGTNGTIQIPLFINNTRKRVSIYISRHHYDDKKIKKGFDIKKDISIKNIVKNIKNQKIKIYLNCNLIYKEIDSISEIYKYLDYAILNNVSGVTFRELSEITLNSVSMYNDYVYNYEKYYKKNIILVKDIHKQFIESGAFVFFKRNGNYYDDNKWYRYNNFIVKLRQISEKKLIEYNNKFNGLDEWTIFPDGSLNMCWDKKLKKINI